MAEPETKVNQMSLLPQELLLKIFGMLTVKEKGRCAVVCRKWRSTIYHPHLWSDVTFVLKRRVEPKHNRPLVKSLASRDIRKVELLKYPWKLLEFDFVKLVVLNLKKLVQLRLSYIENPDQVLKLISRHLAGLLHLTLEIYDGVELTDVGIGHLTGQDGDVTLDIPRLRFLKIDRCDELTDKAFECLSTGQPHLQSLVIINAIQMSDSGLEFLSRIVTLKQLSVLGDLRGLSDAGLEHLTTLPDLQDLQLGDHFHITGTGLRLLQGSLTLRTLSVGGLHNTSMVTWSYLSDIPNLRELSISGSGMGDADLRLLCHGRSQITRLEIGFHVTDAGLASLALLPWLQELSLSATCGVTGSGLGHLARDSSKLSGLYLEGCARLNRSRAFIHIVRMRRLRRLVWPQHIHLTRCESRQLAICSPDLHVTTYSEPCCCIPS